MQSPCLHLTLTNFTPTYLILMSRSKFLTVSKSLESLNLVCELAKLKEYVGGVTTQVEVLQKTLPTYSSKILSEVRCWQSRMDKERASLLERIEAEKATLAGVTDRLEEVKRERNRDITKLEALNKGLTGTYILMYVCTFMKTCIIVCIQIVQSYRVCLYSTGFHLNPYTCTVCFFHYPTKVINFLLHRFIFTFSSCLTSFTVVFNQ